LYDPEALNYLSRSKEPHALLVGLQPDTYYYVQVSAYNAAGPGPLSEPQFGEIEIFNVERTPSTKHLTFHLVLIFFWCFRANIEESSSETANRCSCGSFGSSNRESDLEIRCNFC